MWSLFRRATAVSCVPIIEGTIYASHLHPQHLLRILTFWSFVKDPLTYNVSCCGGVFAVHGENKKQKLKHYVTHDWFYYKINSSKK
jgi:hypothetical protein